MFIYFLRFEGFHEPSKRFFYAELEYYPC